MYDTWDLFNQSSKHTRMDACNQPNTITVVVRGSRVFCLEVCLMRDPLALVMLFHLVTFPELCAPMQADQLCLPTVCTRASLSGTANQAHYGTVRTEGTKVSILLLA